jgi:replicative DNA helicase
MDSSLALKYRPKTFDGVVGQKAVSQLLKLMVSKGAVPQTILLTGPKGSGKTSTARVLGAALNCDFEDDSPCGKCPSCEAVFDGSSLDYREIDASTNGLVGDIRRLQEELLYQTPGKCQVVVLDEAMSLDTPLPTPYGWTSMGEVQEGDEVLGANGLPVKVLRKTEVFYGKDCYLVTLQDGSSVTVSGNHLWKVRRQWGAPEVRTTEDLAKYKTRLQVPRAQPWVLPEKHLTVPPYLLGLWLGDGDSNAAHISGLLEDVLFYQTVLNTLGIETKLLRTQEGKASRLSFAGPNGTGQVRRQIRTEKGKQRYGKPIGYAYPLRDKAGDSQSAALRSLPCYGNKHIPEEYLRGSYSQRVELLQGLMDSDGYVGKDRHCTYVGNDDLTLGVMELLVSLGQTCTRRWVQDDRSLLGGYFKVEFSTRNGLVPVKLPRKVVRVGDTTDCSEWVSIKSIERIESVPVQCLEVDSEDHLFLAGLSGTVTHNCHGLSSAAANALLKTLEEAPEGVVFVLVSTEPEKIMSTIRSRCMTFQFRRVAPDIIAKRLYEVNQAEKLDVSTDVLVAIADRVDGALRDALMLLDQISRAGISDVTSFNSLFGTPDFAPQLISAMESGDFVRSFDILDDHIAITGNPSAVLNSVVAALRDIMVIQGGGKTTLRSSALKSRTELSKRISAMKLMAAMRVLWDLKVKLRVGEDSTSALSLAVTMMISVLADESTLVREKVNVSV